MNTILVKTILKSATSNAMFAERLARLDVLTEDQLESLVTGVLDHVWIVDEKALLKCVQKRIPKANSIKDITVINGIYVRIEYYITRTRYFQDQHDADEYAKTGKYGYTNSSTEENNTLNIKNQNMIAYATALIISIKMLEGIEYTTI